MRGLLDGYAGISTDRLQQLWQQWRLAQKALADARDAQDSLQRERERLAWRWAVDKLAPGADEWETLNASHTRLSHAQALIEAAQGAHDVLDGDEGGARAALAQALEALRAQEHLEPQFADIVEVLASSLRRSRRSAAHSLQAYLRKTDVDPQRLAELDERMGSWLSLARRYKRTPAELPGLLAGWKDELAKLDAAADLAALEATERRARGGFPGGSTHRVQGACQGSACARQGRDAGHAGPGHAGRPL